jgi:hypothetical protein
MGDSVDIKDLSIGNILSLLKKLKLGSLIWLVSSILVILISVYGAGAVSKIGIQKSPVFIQHFTENFVDRDHLELLLPEIMEESPDGIETDVEALSSLLWQLKSQDGYAQFLKGSKYFSVQVTHDGESFNFKWDRGPSAIPKILKKLSLPIDAGSIAQLNAELNLIGVAWLPDNTQIVRDIDGGVVVVGKQ